MSGLVDAAVAMHVPVFPCGDDKRPLIKWRDGATTDPARIVGMFRRTGGSMIGMPSGPATGVVVLDIDVKDGSDGRPWLQEHGGELPDTKVIETRSGGLHFWFACPLERTVKNSIGRIATGIDFRSDGGFVIVPPSPGYSVLYDRPLAPMPDWLLQAVTRPEPVYEPIEMVLSDSTTPYGRRALDSACERIRMAPSGQQEHTLGAQSLAMGSLISGGEIEASEAAAALINAGISMACHRAGEPWLQSEVSRTVNRCLLKGAQTPRSAPKPGSKLLETMFGVVAR